MILSESINKSEKLKVKNSLDSSIGIQVACK